MTKASYSQDALVHDALIAGDFPIRTALVTIASGQAALKRGTLLGKISATSKCIVSLSAAADGSQAPYAVLAEDTAAAGADLTALVYLTGDMKASEMTFGAGHSAASTKDALRNLSIFLA